MPPNKRRDCCMNGRTACTMSFKGFQEASGPGQLVHVLRKNGIWATLFDNLNQRSFHNISDWSQSSIVLLIIAYLECVFDRFFHDSRGEAPRSDFNGSLDAVFR